MWKNSLENSLNKFNRKIGWTNWVDKLGEKNAWKNCVQKLFAKIVCKNCVKNCLNKTGGKIVHCTLYSVQCTMYSKVMFLSLGSELLARLLLCLTPQEDSRAVVGDLEME